MILVTGGAGYIGSVLVPELLARGHAVRVLDKGLFGFAGLSGVAGRIELVRGDLRSLDPAVLEGVTGVINLAGLSNDPMADFHPRANHEMNTAATASLARAACQRGIRRFVQASSCSIYDLGVEAPDLLRDETSDVKPRAAYAVSKHDAERLLLDMAGDDFCPVLLRKGTVYGYSPRMRYDLVVNTFVKDALTRGRLRVDCGGEMWRPLIDVKDVARAYLLALEAPEPCVRGEIFNLVERNYRILELAHLVRDALKAQRPVEIDVDYTPGRARSYRVAGGKAAEVLGFSPAIGVRESVLDMVQRVREAGQDDFLHPRYYNITWLKALLELEDVLKATGGQLL